MNVNRSGAVAMSALLLLSALAVPGLLVAPAAAAQSATIDTSTTKAGMVSTHSVNATVESADDNESLNKFEVDYSVGSLSADVSNVDQNDIVEAYIFRANGDSDPINVTDDISSVGASNNGETLDVGLNGNYPLYRNDTVRFVYEDVQNADNTGTQETEIAINTQSTDNPATANYSVSENGRWLNLTVSGDGAGEYGTHIAAYSPGQSAANESLTNLTIDYGDSFQGSVGYVLYSYVDVDQNNDYNASVDRILNDTGVTHENGSVTVAYDGNYSLNTTDTVRTLYRVENPPTADDYTASVYPNHNRSVAATDTYTITAGGDRWVYAYASPDYAGAQSTHVIGIDGTAGDAGDSLNSIQVDYSAGANASDISDVGREDVERVTIQRYVEDEGYTTIDVTDDLSEVDGSNDGKTLTLNFGGSYDLQADDEIRVVYSDVRNPSSEGYTEVAVDTNVQSGENPVTDGLFIREAELSGYVGPTYDENSLEGTDNATWQATVVPGEETHGDSLQSITVDYGAVTDAEAVDSFDGDVSNVSNETIVTAAGTTAYRPDGWSDIQNLTVTSVDAGTDSVTFEFAGDYTLNRTHSVGLGFYGVENPSDGLHVVNLTLNGENTVTESYRIEPNTTVTGAAISAANDTRNATTNYTVSATVDTVGATDELNTVTASFEAANLDDATVESVSIEGDDGTTTLDEGSYYTYAWDDYLDVSVYDERSIGDGDTVVVELSNVSVPDQSGVYNTTVNVNPNYDVQSSPPVTTYEVTQPTTGGSDDGSSGGSDDGSSGGSTGGGGTGGANYGGGTGGADTDDTPAPTATPAPSTSTPADTATATPTVTETATATQTATTTQTATATDEPTATGTESTSTTGPGLGVVSGVVALALVAFVLRRER